MFYNMPVILNLYYKTTEIKGDSLKLTNGGCFILEHTPIYNTSNNKIGIVTFSDTIQNNCNTSYISETGTYFIENLGTVSYVYSFTKDLTSNVSFTPGTILIQKIEFTSGIYIGYKGEIIINVIDNILRNVSIIINN